MENKQSPPKNKAKYKQEEKLIRKVDYDTFAGVTRISRDQPLQMVSGTRIGIKIRCINDVHILKSNVFIFIP